VTLEKTLQYLGIFWSVVAFVAVVVFFAGGQWEHWKAIRDAHVAGNVINRPAPETPDLSIYVTQDEMNAALTEAHTSFAFDTETLRREWDENEVFLTFEDFEFELEQLGLTVKGRPIDFVTYGQSVHLGFVSEGIPYKLTTKQENSGNQELTAIAAPGTTRVWTIEKE
jgi:hypothetical protein